MKLHRSRDISSLIGRPLSMAEAEDLLQRIYQSTDTMTAEIPIPSIPLLLGCLAGAMDAPFLSDSRKASLYRLIFQLEGFLDEIAPGLNEFVFSPDVSGNDVTAAADAMSASLTDPEADCFTWTTDGGQEE